MLPAQDEKVSGGFGKCFYLGFCTIQLGKHRSPITCCKGECLARYTTHQIVSLGKRQLISLILLRGDVTRGALRGRRGKEEEDSRLPWSIHRDLSWGALPS